MFCLLWAALSCLCAQALDSSDNALFVAATALIEAGRMGEAVVGLTRALEELPGHWDVLHLLGSVHLSLGDHERGVALLTEAVGALEGVKGGPPAHVCSNYLEALRKTGRMDQALSLFAPYIALHPDDLHIRENAGFLLADAGRTAEAADHFAHVARHRWVLYVCVCVPGSTAPSFHSLPHSLHPPLPQPHENWITAMEQGNHISRARQPSYDTRPNSRTHFSPSSVFLPVPLDLHAGLRSVHRGADCVARGGHGRSLRGVGT